MSAYRYPPPYAFPPREFHVPPAWTPPTYAGEVTYPSPAPVGQAYVAPDWFILNARGPMDFGVDYLDVVAPRARKKDRTLIRSMIQRY